MQREVISFFRVTEILRRKKQASCWVHESSSRPEIEAEVCKTEYQWRTIALSMTSCVNQFCFPCAKEPHRPSVKTHCPETTPTPGATAVAEAARLSCGPELGHHPARASRCPECQGGTHKGIHHPSAPSPQPWGHCPTLSPCPGDTLILGSLSYHGDLGRSLGT